MSNGGKLRNVTDENRTDHPNDLVLSVKLNGKTLADVDNQLRANINDPVHSRLLEAVRAEMVANKALAAGEAFHLIADW